MLTRLVVIGGYNSARCSPFAHGITAPAKDWAIHDRGRRRRAVPSDTPGRPRPLRPLPSRTRRVHAWMSQNGRHHSILAQVSTIAGAAFQGRGRSGCPGGFSLSWRRTAFPAFSTRGPVGPDNFISLHEPKSRRCLGSETRRKQWPGLLYAIQSHPGAGPRQRFDQRRLLLPDERDGLSKGVMEGFVHARPGDYPAV